MLYRIVFAASVCLTFTSQCLAQFSGGPSPDRFFGYLDRNQDGRIDGDEMQRAPGPLRDALQNARFDPRRGMSRDDFAREMPRLMEEMRRRREESGGYRGPGGPPGSGRGPGGDSRGDGRGPGDYRGRDDRGRGSDSRRREPEKPKRWLAKERERVTRDLDESWKSADINGDGQIGFYEWDRAQISEFLRLDTNHDGLLTPTEIFFAQDATPAATSTPVTASTTKTAGPTRPATVSRPASSPAPTSGSGGSVSPVEFDPESAEGRWATYVFKRLDKNRDGSLDANEWKASQTTRRSFEKYQAKVSFPTDFKQFSPWLVAVQRAEKKR